MSKRTKTAKRLAKIQRRVERRTHLAQVRAEYALTVGRSLTAHEMSMTALRLRDEQRVAQWYVEEDYGY